MQSALQLNILVIGSLFVAGNIVARRNVASLAASDADAAAAGAGGAANANGPNSFRFGSQAVASHSKCK